MSYNKRLINGYYIDYVKTHDEVVLGLLVTSCGSMIDVVLSHYTQDFYSYLEDMRQEIEIKLVESLRKNPRLQNYCVSPSSYLFFKVRLYARVVSGQYRKIFDLGSPLNKMEAEILSLMEEGVQSLQQIAEFLHIKQETVNTHYKEALKKQSMLKIMSGSSEVAIGGELENPGSGAYFLDPLQQLLAKEAITETLEECIDNLCNHPVYSQDKELLEKMSERLILLFSEEFGTGDFL